MQKKLILNKSTVTIRKPGMSGTQMVVPRRPKPVPVQGVEPNFAEALPSPGHSNPSIKLKQSFG